MPFVKKNPNPNGEMTGLRDQEHYLKKLIRNPTLTPAKRLKNIIRLMWMLSTGNKKKILQTILYGQQDLVLDRNDGAIPHVKYYKTMIRKVLNDTNLSAEKQHFAYYLLSWISSTGNMESLTRRDLLECKSATLKNGLDDNWEKDESDEKVLKAIGAIERGNATV